METSLSERIVCLIWHSLNTGFQRVCKILVCVHVVHGDIYVWIMHFVWPSSIVWRQSFADICWAFLAGWLQKAPHSEIPQSFQRDTLEQTELENIQLRSLAPVPLFSLVLFLPLITLLYLPLRLFILSLVSVSFVPLFWLLSFSLCSFVCFAWKHSSNHLQFSHCLRNTLSIRVFTRNKKQTNTMRRKHTFSVKMQTAISETHKMYKRRELSFI